MTPSPVNLRTCDDVRACFSEYLDGVSNGRIMQGIATHLRECVACTDEFAAWRTVQDSLAALRKPAVPIDLSLKLRLAISRERSRSATRMIDVLSLHWDNALRPLLVQVSAGFALAVALLGTVGLLLGTVAVPPAVLANDEPLGALTAPHYLYSAERSRPLVTPRNVTIVVDAQVNAEGRVFDYIIVPGPQSDDLAIRNQVRDRLLLSVFEPARVFGSPVRGRVVVTFSGVSVRG